MRLTKHTLNCIKTAPLTDLETWLSREGATSLFLQESLSQTAMEKQMEEVSGTEKAGLGRRCWKEVQEDFKGSEKWPGFLRAVQRAVGWEMYYLES